MRVCELVCADAGALSKFSLASRTEHLPAVSFVFAIVDSSAKLGDIAKVGDTWPVVGQDTGCGFVILCECDGSESDVLGGEAESANTAEKVKVCWCMAHVGIPPGLRARAAHSCLPFGLPGRRKGGTKRRTVFQSRFRQAFQTAATIFGGGSIIESG